MTLDQAIKLLKEEYEKASKLKWVHNPLAFALYEVWKRVNNADTTKVERKIMIEDGDEVRPSKVYKKIKLYSVWDNKNDNLLIIDGRPQQCADLMNVALGSFYSIFTRSKKGEVKRWHIECREVKVRKKVRK